jgi:hypothetical protein
MADRHNATLADRTIRHGQFERVCEGLLEGKIDDHLDVTGPVRGVDHQIKLEVARLTT